MSYARARNRTNTDLNKLRDDDRPAHEWYRFVLSFPPHLVRDYVQRFGLRPGARLLDPFCGTGTTIVEAKKLGIIGIGVEANPMAHFASQVKTNWTLDPDGLLQHAQQVAARAQALLQRDDIEDNPLFFAADTTHVLRRLPSDAEGLLLANSISPLPLHKTLVLLDCLEHEHNDNYTQHERLALAKALVATIGNLHFGPEVGVGVPKVDTPVIAAWLKIVYSIANDLRQLHKDTADSHIYLADAREIQHIIEPQSIDALITSPPYPNEKDYTRATRLESVLLGFLHNKDDLRALKQGLMRSNTRNVYKHDDDDHWIENNEEIQQIATAIEARRIALGKTSGFERLYGRVTKLYFGGMARHLAELRPALRPGAYLAYVVGDQASFLRVMIRTGQLLSDIAQTLGYETVSIDLFRTRIATATREQMREEVVVLRWPG